MKLTPASFMKEMKIYLSVKIFSLEKQAFFWILLLLLKIGKRYMRGDNFLFSLFLLSLPKFKSPISQPFLKNSLLAPPACISLQSFFIVQFPLLCILKKNFLILNKYFLKVLLVFRDVGQFLLSNGAYI